MIDLLLDSLACYRLTRLVTRDTVTRPLRARIIRWAYRKPWGEQAWAASQGQAPVRWTEAEWDQLPHDDDDAPKLATLVICDWCMSVYISFGVIVARRYARGVWQPVSQALALSAAAALIGGLEAE